MKFTRNKTKLVNHDYLHGKRVELTHGYHKGEVGKVTNVFVADITKNIWNALVRPENGVPAVGLGTWGKQFIIDVSHLKVLPEL